MTVDTMAEPEARVEDSFISLFGAALRGEPCSVHGVESSAHWLPVPHWSKNADTSDQELLSYCSGPTLDIGCGPGRMSAHLAERGMGVLGIDVVPEAVLQTRARGASALLGNVFDQVPGEGHWGSALLADGNIGIGGDPTRLLRRVAELLAPGGRAVADLAPPGTAQATHTVVLRCAGALTRPFQWSVVGPESMRTIADAAGLTVDLLREHDGRWFAVLLKEV